ncbi:MAG TPA: PH domain-containing protein, partial [Fimbriimonadaceae bacterium]|nr:PH domain-containing protein [Fimbriimonadaceae bacterium]
AELLTGSPKLENAELPEQLPERGAEDVYKVSSEDLLLGAATENNGGQIVFGLGSLIGVGALVNVIERGGSWMDMIPSSLFIWLGLALVIAVVFVGWIWGGISYALKYGGFSVRREAGAYLVSHGVLTKVQYAIRPGRIEFAEITATLFQRKLDRCTFYVGTAGSFGEQGLVAPLGLMVERDEAERALETILGRNHLSGLDWRPMPKLYIRIVLFGFARSLLLWLGLGWLITTLAQSPLVAHWTQTAISIILGLSTLGLLGTLWGIRLMRYASSDRALVFERGFFTKRLSLMPVERMEVLDVSQPVWWEGKGAARLTAVGMLHRLQVPLLASETIEALQGRLRQEYALRQDLRKGRRAAEVPFLVDDGV